MRAFSSAEGSRPCGGRKRFRLAGGRSQIGSSAGVKPLTETDIAEIEEGRTSGGYFGNLDALHLLALIAAAT